MNNKYLLLFMRIMRRQRARHCPCALKSEEKKKKRGHTL